MRLSAVVGMHEGGTVFAVLDRPMRPIRRLAGRAAKLESYESVGSAVFQRNMPDHEPGDERHRDRTRTNSDQARTTDAGRVTSRIRRASVAGGRIGEVSNWIGGTTTSTGGNGKRRRCGDRAGGRGERRGCEPARLGGAVASRSRRQHLRREVVGELRTDPWRVGSTRRGLMRQAFEELGLDPQVLGPKRGNVRRDDGRDLRQERRRFSDGCGRAGEPMLRP